MKRCLVIMVLLSCLSGVFADDANRLLLQTQAQCNSVLGARQTVLLAEKDGVTYTYTRWKDGRFRIALVFRNGIAEFIAGRDDSNETVIDNIMETNRLPGTYFRWLNNASDGTKVYALVDRTNDKPYVIPEINGGCGAIRRPGFICIFTMRTRQLVEYIPALLPQEE